MKTNDQVKKIIDYLEGKISHLKDALAKYDSPMMQEMAKNSPHLQMEYTRLTVELQANEDNLLAIRTFSTEVKQVPEKKKQANGIKKQKEG